MIIKSNIMNLFSELYVMHPKKTNEFFPDIFNNLSPIIDFAFKKPENYVKNNIKISFN